MGVTYLFPVDGSENSGRAAAFYLERYRRDDDHLIFVHVVEPNFREPALSISPDHGSPMVGEMTVAMREAVTAGKSLIKKHLVWSREQGITSRSFIYIDSKPAAAVLKAARNLKVDHIVLTSRGLNALGRTILGSMSTHIVHHSTIPVTIVPIPPSVKPAGLIRRLSLN